jgi:hypothetical protein
MPKRPEKRLVRLGMQGASEAWTLSKTTPSRARRSMFGLVSRP